MLDRLYLQVLVDELLLAGGRSKRVLDLFDLVLGRLFDCLLFTHKTCFHAINTGHQFSNCLSILVDCGLEGILVRVFSYLHGVLNLLNFIRQTTFLLLQLVHFLPNLLLTVLLQIVVQIIRHFAQIPQLHG